MIAAGTNPERSVGDSSDRRVDSFQLLNRLAVDRNVFKSLDGDAGALADSFPERDSAGRDVGAVTQQRRPALEFEPDLLEHSRVGGEVLVTERAVGGSFIHGTDDANAAQHDPFCHDVIVGIFADETLVEPVTAGEWRVELVDHWNIGSSANGGYALTPVLRALHELGGHTDPIAVTTHFLRPVQVAPGTVAPGQVRAELIRTGRTTSVARGSLLLEGRERLTVMAAFGELVPGQSTDHEITLAAPTIPGPDDCIGRRELDQGVELPILDRLDIRIHPDRVVADVAGDAVMEGWIRLSDGSDPTTMTLPLFSDAFPPTLFSKFGQVGWVPSVELTVHVRRRPAPGWVQARFECDDLVDGRMIETGALWDQDGKLIARSRQLGLLLGD